MDHQDSIDTMVAICGCSTGTSTQFLEQHNWVVDAAISAYFDSVEQGLSFPEETLVFPPYVPPVYVPEPVISLERSIITVEDVNEGNKRAVLRKVEINAQIIDFTAKVDTKITFHNQSDNSIEGVFKFFQPDSTVCGFEVERDGKKYVADIKEKEKGKKEYQNAIQSGKSAVIAESDAEEIGVFQTRIGLFPANSTTIIRFIYLTQLQVKENAIILEFPITTVPFEKEDNNGLSLSCDLGMSHSILHISSDFPIKSNVDLSDTTIGTITYSTDERLWEAVRIVLRLENLYEPAALVETYSIEDPDLLNAEVLENNKEKARKHGQELCAMVNFYPDLKGQLDDEPTEIVFLLDRSGSMAGSRINQAKNALQLFLRSLHSSVLFNIVSFGGGFSKLFATSQKYNRESFEEATAAIDKFDANMGGTNILDPLTNILSAPLHTGYPRQLFVVTDGEVSNTRQVLAEIRQHAANTRVFTFGIGADASRALVKGMAREGRGFSEFVVSGERVEAKILAQLTKALKPAVTDLTVDFTMSEQAKRQLRVYPQLIPPVFDGEQMVLFVFSPRNEHLPTGPSEVILRGKLGGQIKEWKVEIDWSLPMPDIVFHQVAASVAIRELENIIVRTPHNSTAIAECVQLSTTYSIASTQTVFVSVQGQLEAAQHQLDEQQVMIESYLPQRSIPGGSGSGGNGGIVRAQGAVRRSRGRAAPSLSSASAFGSVSNSAPLNQPSNDDANFCQMQIEEEKKVSSVDPYASYFAPAPQAAPQYGMPGNSSPFSAGPSVLDQNNWIHCLSNESSSQQYKSKDRKRAKSKSVVHDSMVEQEELASSDCSGASPAEMDDLLEMMADEAPASKKRKSNKSQSSAEKEAVPSFVNSPVTFMQSRFPPSFAAQSQQQPAPVASMSVARGKSSEPTDRMESAPRRRGAAKKKEAFEKPLDRSLSSLVLLQDFEGRWEANESLAIVLGLEYSVLLGSVPVGVNPTVWATLLAIAELRTRYSDSIEEWKLLVNKANKWVRQMDTEADELEAAAAAFIASHRQ